MSAPLRSAFFTRLTAVVRAELANLTTLLEVVHFTGEPDIRGCPWQDAAGKLSSTALYTTVIASGHTCAFYKFVWENCAPPKVKFFGWLLVQDRAQTKANLLKKHCIDSDTCDVCGGGNGNCCSS
jgi:hypothetical protein